MKKYLLFFVFLSVHLCACEDFLDQKSQMQVDAEHMFQTEQGFKDALTQCYVGLAGDYLYGKYMSYGPIETMAQHWNYNQITGRTCTSWISRLTMPDRFLN